MLSLARRGQPLHRPQDARTRELSRTRREGSAYVTPCPICFYTSDPQMFNAPRRFCARDLGVFRTPLENGRRRRPIGLRATRRTDAGLTPERHRRTLLGRVSQRGRSSMAEHLPSKQDVDGSSPFARFFPGFTSGLTSPLLQVKGILRRRVAEIVERSKRAAVSCFMAVHGRTCPSSFTSAGS